MTVNERIDSSISRAAIAVATVASSLVLASGVLAASCGQQLPATKTATVGDNSEQAANGSVGGLVVGGRKNSQGPAPGEKDRIEHGTGDECPWAKSEVTEGMP